MEVSRSTHLRKLKQEINRKITFLQHKAVIDYKEIYQLIRKFFKVYLERPYEFTISELRQEIKSTYIPITVREEVNALLSTIEHMEYRSVSYSHEELNAILDKFKHVVDALIKVSTRKKTFFEKVRTFVFKQELEPLIISELPVIENDDAEHIHLNILLERTYSFIGKKSFSRAKKQYKELLTYYDTVSDDVKREFYPLIDEAYADLIKSKEKKKK